MELKDVDPIENAIVGLTASPDGICFAATHTGVLKSSDFGHTWESAFASLTRRRGVPVTAVALSSRFNADGTLFAAIPGGIGRSSDHGEHWDFIALPLPIQIISAFAISPDFAHDRIIFASTTDDGVLRLRRRGHRPGRRGTSAYSTTTSFRSPSHLTSRATARSWREHQADSFAASIAANHGKRLISTADSPRSLVWSAQRTQHISQSQTSRHSIAQPTSAKRGRTSASLWSPFKQSQPVRPSSPSRPMKPSFAQKTLANHGRRLLQITIRSHPRH